MSEEEYLKKRLDDQIEWYSVKASTNKQLHNWSKILIIIFSASIPLIAGFEICDTYKNFFLGLLGTLIAIISGISGLLKFQEKWGNIELLARL